MAVCGNMLVVTGAGAEAVSEFIVPAAKPGRGSGTFEAAHRLVSAFDAPVILFQPVVEVAAGPVPHLLAQLGADRAGVAVVAVRRDPVGVIPVTALAERKNACAAAMSRCSLNSTSTSAPERSMAR